LDGFKRVNDTHGHQAGDALLREVATRLRAAVRQSDTVGRLGGDEFTVLLPGAIEAGAAAAARKIVQVLEQPFALEGRAARAGCGVGMALFPDHGKNPADLMNHADLAMYSAKRAGGGFAVYSAARVVAARAS